MADTLTNYPLSENAYLEVSYDIFEVGFAGYTQRMGNGINVVRKKFHYETIPITNTQAEALMSFFNTRQGTTAFLFTPPGESSALRWVAKQPKKMYAGYPGMFMITATFEQDFGSG
jgi:phage-related protein